MAVSTTPSAPGVSLAKTLTVTAAFSEAWVALSGRAVGTSSTMVMVKLPGAVSPSRSVTSRLKVTEVVSPAVLSVRVKL